MSAALKQAAQALEGAINELESVLAAINDDRIPHDGDEFHERLGAAREALAALEAEPQQAQAPKGWSITRKDDWNIRVQSPAGTAWVFENPVEKNTSAQFVYDLLTAMLAAAPRQGAKP